jgi:heterodisulfide reductase subunit B
MGTTVNGRPLYYTDERTHYARKKMEQIRRAGVDMIVVPCHVCHGQLKAMVAAYDMPDFQVKYLWEVTADALVVQNETLSPDND